MSKPGLILVGAGGHACSCIDVVEEHGEFDIAGLIGLPDELYTDRLGYPVIASEGDLPNLVESIKFVLIAVGQVEDPGLRTRIYKLVVRLGFLLPAIVSPTAYVSRHAIIGAGTVVMHRAVINAGATVGANCIINSHALIEHAATVGDHCHISTGAILNGDAKIGSGSFVGSGSKIKEGVSVGQGCLIGMGSSVRHDLGNFTRFIQDQNIND